MRWHLRFVQSWVQSCNDIHELSITGDRAVLRQRVPGWFSDIGAADVQRGGGRAGPCRFCAGAGAGGAGRAGE
jgi:hypothetical protein